MDRSGRSELYTSASLLLACASALIIWHYSSVDVFGNDAAQYVSVSDTYATTGKLATTALYYELHHNLGMPAAQTVWPPGIPLLIGSLERLTGADSVDLIGAVNALAHLLSVVMLYSILTRIIERRRIAIFLTACYAFHAYSLYLAATGLSEPLYTLCLLSVALGLSRALEREVRIGWFLFAACLAGVACLVRYQSLVCAGALALSVLVVCLRRGLGPLRSFSWAALAVVPFALVFGGLVLRNLEITQTITGGPAVSGGQPLVPILMELARDLLQVASGPLKPFSLGFRLLLIGAVAVLVVQSLLRIRADGWARDSRSDVRLGLIVYGITLSVGTALLIVLLALKTAVYAVELRYLIPTVPTLLIAVAGLLAWDDRRFASASGKWLGGAVAASLVALTLMSLSGWHTVLKSRHDVASLRQILDTELRDGTSVASMLAASAGNGAPLMSNQSQQLHLALRKPTLGVPERRLSARRWNEADLHRLARRFNVNYIVLFKNRPLGGAHGSNDYVLPLAQQRPAWTRSVLSTPDLELLEVKPEVQLTETAR